MYDPTLLNPWPYATGSHMSILSSAIATVEVRKTDNSLIVINSVNDPNRISIIIPAIFDLTKLRNISNPQSTGYYPTCRYYSVAKKQWISDSTCRVGEFSSISIRCDCTHLTSFAATYDYYEYNGNTLPEPSLESSIHHHSSPIPSPAMSTPEKSTDTSRELRLGLGIGIGIGVPMVAILSIGSIASGIAIYLKFFKHGTSFKQENNNSMNNSRSSWRWRRNNNEDLNIFNDHSIDIEMKSW
jgi:hypothetical protein